MIKTHGLFGLFAEIPWYMRIVLGSVPFLLMILGYWGISALYLVENPDGKLLPSYAQMAERLVVLATQPDRRSGEILLWLDMGSSLKRLLMSMAAAGFVGIMMGIVTAFYPVWRYTLSPFITFFSNVPIISLIAILMLFLGMDELFKFALIFLATVFIVTRDVQNSALKVPNEMITKTLSLGASQRGTVFRVMLPRLMPDALKAIKFVLGTAWVYTLAAEMIRSSDGIGQRIVFARRSVDMELIIPYVMVVTLMAFALNMLMDLWIRIVYPWYQEDE